MIDQCNSRKEDTDACQQYRNILNSIPVIELVVVFDLYYHLGNIFKEQLDYS